MLFFLTSSTETRLRDLPRDAVHCPEVLSSYSNTTKKKVSPYCFRFKKKSESHSVLGANTRDPTPNKAVREKTWRARPIRFSGVSKRPAHEIPPMTKSQGESLTGKADQVFRDSEKLPPALTLKMISVFLMPASIDYSLISVTQAEGLPWSLSK